jgi:hypothetical protein
VLVVAFDVAVGWARRGVDRDGGDVDHRAGDHAGTDVDDRLDLHLDVHHHRPGHRRPISDVDPSDADDHLDHRNSRDDRFEPVDIDDHADDEHHTAATGHPRSGVRASRPAG